MNAASVEEGGQVVPKHRNSGCPAWPARGCSRSAEGHTPHLPSTGWPHLPRQRLYLVWAKYRGISANKRPRFADAYLTAKGLSEAIAEHGSQYAAAARTAFRNLPPAEKAKEIAQAVREEPALIAHPKLEKAVSRAQDENLMAKVRRNAAGLGLSFAQVMTMLEEYRETMDPDDVASSLGFYYGRLQDEAHAALKTPRSHAKADGMTRLGQSLPGSS